MNIESIELEVNSRITGCKHNNRQVRIKKQIPGIVYGPKTKSTPIVIREKDVIKYFNREYENTIFNLNSSGKDIQNLKVLVKDIAYHPVTDRPIHVDLYALEMDKPVRVTVDVVYVGTPIGLTEGGILQEVNREIEVECLPSHIPKRIEMDISNLGLNKSFHVSDLKLAEGIKPITPAKQTLVTITLPKEETTSTTEVSAAEGASTATSEPATGSSSTGKKPETKK